MNLLASKPLDFQTETAMSVYFHESCLEARMIELKNVNKTFKVAKRNAGLSEAVKALFRKEYIYMKLCLTQRRFLFPRP